MPDLTYGGSTIPTGGNAITINILGASLGLEEDFPPQVPTLIGTAAKVVGSPVFGVTPQGIATVTYTLNPVAKIGQTIKLSWPAGMVSDTQGNINQAFSEEIVANNSSVPADPPGDYTNRTRIQNFIIDTVKAGPFHEVRYDKITGHAEGIDPFTDTPILPSTVVANEVRSGFGVNSHNGQSFRLHRNSWLFQSLVRFDREVSAETFENQLADNPPFLAANPDFNQSSIRLLLTGVEALHPVTGQPSSGSQFKFTFQAITGRA